MKDNLGITTWQTGWWSRSRERKARGAIMENKNFLVLDGGLGLELIRAGFDINVSN